MSDSAWVLKGIGPDTRARALEEADRLGVSLADYLTDQLLRAVVFDQIVASPVAEEIPDDADDAELGVRSRLRTIERQLKGSLDGLGAAQRTLDASFFDVSERVGELEDLASGTARALQQGLQDTADHLVALRQQTESRSAVHASENETAHKGLASSISALSRRTQDIDALARRADTSVTALVGAHEQLKQAVASDFVEFSDQISVRLNAGLRDVAAAADEAAAQADAAVAHLVIELRGVRESLEQSVAEGVDETRRRVHAAFLDVGQRMQALSDRVDQVDRQSTARAEQAHTRMADVEDAAQVALEETAESLRQAGAALAADLQRASQDNRAALESVHGDLASEIADLHDRQQGALARLKLLDSAVRQGAADVNILRDQMLARVEEAERHSEARATEVRDAGSERIRALDARLARHVAETSETQFQLRADSERIEASTLVALEKLAGDIAASRNEATRFTEQARAHSQCDIANLREQQLDFHSRLAVIDQVVRAQTALLERIAKVEAALREAAPGAKVSAIEAQMKALRQAVGDGDEALTGHIEDLGARLAKALSGDAALDSNLAELQVQLNLVRQAVRSGEDALVGRIEKLGVGVSEATREDTALNKRLAEVEAHLDILRQTIAKHDDVATKQRLVKLGDETKMNAEKADNLAQLMSRWTVNYGEASAQADERLQKVESAFSELRSEHVAIRETPVASAGDVAALANRVSAVEQGQVSVEDVASLANRVNEVERLAAEPPAPAVDTQDIVALQQRLLVMETRQAEALEILRNDIVRFVTDNDRRLATLEHAEMDYNLAAEFDELRRRVEERILGVEQRSVRTLEQVADTVQMLEERFTAGDKNERQSA